MLEFIQKQLVWAVAMPLGIAIVCMVIAWRPWQRDGRETVRGWWGGPLAVGLGYLVGHVTINQWPAWPPAQPAHRAHPATAAGGPVRVGDPG